MSRIVLASRDEGLETRIRTAFEGELNGQLRRWDDDPEADDTAATVADLVHGAPDVVAIGADVPVDVALRLARVLDRDRPEITVMLITRPTSKLWEAAMKAGVEVVLSPDAEIDEFREEFERALEAADRRREHLATDSPDGGPASSHRIIVVTSPKGGAGKSVVATNLSLGLAQSAPGKVAVVDLDLQFGDIAGAFQLVPQHTMIEAARTPELDLTSLKVFLTGHPSNLYALCAPESPADADEITPDLTGRVLKLLNEEFRYVVVDTSGGIDEHALAAFELATDLVLVGNMDVPSVKALRKEVEVFDQLSMVSQVRHFVLNRADSRVGLDAGDVEATVGMRIDVAIPSSRAVPVSFNQGVPLVQSDPKSPVGRELMKLVSRFARVAAQEHEESGGILRWMRSGS